jgi:hypothetical protein
VQREIEGQGFEFKKKFILLLEKLSTIAVGPMSQKERVEDDAFKKNMLHCMETIMNEALNRTLLVLIEEEMPPITTKNV